MRHSLRFQSLIKFSKFIPLEKAEQQSDGTLFVYGLVTAQVPDAEGEVCDYDSTKPFYKAMVEKFLKATSAVDGMETSIAPLREMHQLKAIGCGKQIDFDDDGKTIRMGFKVVDADAVKKFKAGVLIGFSQGGDYVKTWKSGGHTWYTADPGEVSAVDSPCLESALVERMKGREFTFAEADGSTRLVKFAVEKKDKEPYGDVEYADPGYQSDKKKRYPVDTEEHIRAAWSYIGQEKNASKYSASEVASIKRKIVAAWKKHIDAGGPPSADKAADAEAWLAENALEKEYSSDLQTIIAAFGGKGETMTEQELAKAKDHVKALMGHVEKAHKHHEKMAAHHEKMGEMHKAHGEMHKEHAGHLKEAMACCKAIGEGAIEDKGESGGGVKEKAEPIGDLVKTYDKTEVDTLLKAQADDFQKKLDELKAAGPAPKSTLVPRPGEPAFAKASTNGEALPLD